MLNLPPLHALHGTTIRYDAPTPSGAANAYNHTSYILSPALPPATLAVSSYSLLGFLLLLCWLCYLLRQGPLARTHISSAKCARFPFAASARVSILCLSTSFEYLLTKKGRFKPLISAQHLFLVPCLLRCWTILDTAQKFTLHPQHVVDCTSFSTGFRTPCSRFW